MDVPAQMSLSYSKILFISLFQLVCFSGPPPCRKLGRKPCLYKVVRDWSAITIEFSHAIWIETKVKQSFDPPIF